MLAWLQSLDTALFRFINQTLSCPALDVLMKPLDSNPVFIPAAILGAALLCWKGGTRGRLFVLMAAVIILAGDMMLIGPMKQAVGRLRPFNDILDANVLTGRGGSGSMPSSHTSSWFAGALIAYAYYPWTWRVMVPFAMVVGFSRVYVGVHYPSDTLMGALLGAGYAATLLWTLNAVWRRAGQDWFPLWWQRVPSLIVCGNEKEVAAPAMPAEEERVLRETQFLRLGHLLIAVVLLARLGYIASGTIQLGEDEAYQWLWSKNLALSYWSKPPLIAYVQWLGTHLWGDTEFGVRFFSPVIGAVVSWMMLRFLARVANARLAFLFLLMVTVTPMLAVGSVLMAIDPLAVLFWSAAMIAGWRAAQPEGTTKHWLWVGLWMGLGFLSKYTALLQIGCWAVFFALWRPARAHLRRPGPWLALGVFAVCTLPVIVWNAQHDWVTLQHVSTNAKLEKAWRPTLSYFFEFLGAEAGLLHPVLFVAALWAMAAFWKRYPKQPLLLYFFAMGAPVFLGYWLFSLHSRVQPNWIACAIVPMFCLMAVYWEQRWREGVRAVKDWLFGALALGFAMLPFLFNPDLTWKLARVRVPVEMNPLRRVRGFEGIAEQIGRARRELLAEGREVFIFTPHYGPASQMTFYLPEARPGLPSSPLVYARVGTEPRSQFFFWPQYRYQESRRGQNAIFFVSNDKPAPPPSQLVAEFESVTDLGLFEIKRNKQVYHRVQMWACRNLR
jgi:4-amino-4-deoxy-L-arabinose transferase-like glycosyltransferase/membrane-associated phospholipid phosphatase